MPNEHLLSKVISRLLNEGAKTVQDAMQENIHLLVDEYPQTLRLVLYKSLPKGNYRDFQPIASITLDNEVSTCGSWVVSTSAAEKGYGPLIYDIALSAVYPEWVRADALIKPAAKNVWDKMINVYGDKYENQPQRPVSFSGQSDCDTGLDQQVMVRIKQPLDYDSLFDITLDKEEKREIVWMGRQFFQKKYKE
jgi:hypothetical protein